VYGPGLTGNGAALSGCPERFVLKPPAPPPPPPAKLGPVDPPPPPPATTRYSTASDVGDPSPKLDTEKIPDDLKTWVL
jgi:hypothetical protein